MFGFKSPSRKRAVPRSPGAPEQRAISAAGRAVPLTVREHDSATRITLRIEPGGRALKMTVPRGISRRDVDDFLDRHQGWIDRKIAGYAGAETGLRDGGTLLFCGVTHRIALSGRLRGLTEAVIRDGEPCLVVSGEAAHLGRRLSDFLKREARVALEARVAVHTAALGRRHRSLTLKDTRSRWGSCSAAGNLNFSWRIVMAPPAVLDYLAAHEVAHLEQMNHGPRFWALCERLCPGTEEARAWLKQHGNALQAVDFG